MSRHFLLSPADPLPSRWREAFPEGRCLAAGGDDTELAGLPADALLWACAPTSQLPELVTRLRRAHPDLPAVALDFEPTQAAAVAALEAGARGYCHALATTAMLTQVAVVVSHGGLWVGPELLSRVVAATHRLLPAADAVATSGLDKLSARERAVAEEVARGATNKEVARKLGITERTVKAHLGVAFAKCGVRDRLQLALSLQTRATVEAAA